MSKRLRQLSRAVKGRLPESLVTQGEAAALLLGKATAPLRMTPDFLIVGGQRCGTTTMYRLLSEHPDIARPTFSKGIGYFDLNYDKGANWYRGHFPIGLPLAASKNRVTFESSGYYSYHPLAAERIASDLPGTKLVMLVRDPVERAFSAYKHELRRGFETETFQRALELEPQRLAGEVERIMADPTYESYSHRHHSYVGRGLYADQLERMCQAVGCENVKAIDADAFFNDPLPQLSALFGWLGLSPWLPDSVGRENATPSTELEPSLRAFLKEQFRESDLRLADFLGAEPSWVTS